MALGVGEEGFKLGLPEGTVAEAMTCENAK
jgi:hypothetical protein